MPCNERSIKTENHRSIDPAPHHPIPVTKHLVTVFFSNKPYSPPLLQGNRGHVKRRMAAHWTPFWRYATRLGDPCADITHSISSVPEGIGENHRLQLQGSEAFAGAMEMSKKWSNCDLNCSKVMGYWFLRWNLTVENDCSDELWWTEVPILCSIVAILRGRQAPECGRCGQGRKEWRGE